MTPAHHPKRILILGNLGYIGPVLTQHLRSALPQAELIGYDTAFFETCLLHPATTATAPDTQHYGDIRQLDTALLHGTDTVIALAAISNDPMGMRYETQTMDINAHAIASIAAQAKAAGVTRFIFASSCSVYGSGGSDARTESAPVNPLTAYARSKLACEQALAPLADEHFTVTCLRFATACGLSPRLRLDLVLNDFVASAYLSGHIEILSDGSPWRPLISVADMSRAMEWASLREAANGGAFLVLNTGANHWNYTIRELAEAVAAACPNNVTVRTNPNAAPDKRSYRVDFSRFAELAPEHQPRATLQGTIAELIGGLQRAEFSDPSFREGHLIRFNTLRELETQGRIDPALYWK